MRVGRNPRGFVVRLPPKGDRDSNAGDGNGLTPLQKLLAEEQERERFAQEYQARLEEERRQQEKEEDQKTSSRSESSSASKGRRAARPKRFSTGPRPRVFLEVELRQHRQGGSEEGLLEARARMEFDLFADIVPQTVKNFQQICTGENAKGLHYRGSLFHRIIPGFMAQGGDVTHGDGTGGCSIYGPTFNDENFMARHGSPGALSMVNSGPHTNNSQFFILFQAQPHLDGRHVVFGQLTSDSGGVLALLEAAGSLDGRPRRSVTITACGEVQALGWGPAMKWKGSHSPKKRRQRSASPFSSSGSSTSSASATRSSSSKSPSRGRRRKRRR